MNPLETLAGLLSGRAKVIFAPERLAPSAFYDLLYRMFIIAAVFELHSEPAFGTQRIAAARLKLLQFIGCRPWLLPMVRQWSETRQDAQLSMLSSRPLRRGYLADTMHDDVIGFLVARSILTWSSKHLAVGNIDLLRNLYSRAVGDDLFTTERATIRELGDVTITNHMLEGW